MATAPIKSVSIDSLSLPELQVKWLRKMNLGIILIVLGIDIMASIFISFYAKIDLRNWLSENAYSFLSFIAALIGCLGIWLLVTPEPGNKKELWYLRWLLRSIVILDILANVVGFFVPLKETFKSSIFWNCISTIHGLGILFLFMFLSYLAIQLEIAKPRKSFVVLMWISGFFVAIYLLGAVNRFFESSVKHCSPKIAAETSSDPNFIGMGLFTIFIVWLNILFLKFAKQLRGIADKKTDACP